jgi:hypothetical protein
VIVVALGLALFLVGAGVLTADAYRKRAAAAAMTATNLSGGTVVSCIKQFYAEGSRYPKSLTELMPMYLERLPLDGWRRPFVYRVESDGSVTLMSLGADGCVGGTGPAMDIWWRIGGGNSGNGVGFPPPAQ